MRCTVLFTILFIFSQNLFAADFDNLANRSITFSSPNPAGAMDAFVSNPIAIFNVYKPAVDPGAKLLAPFKASGSQNHPILTMTVQECVFIICETVAFDADVSIQEVSGNCLRNVEIDADLSHSSDNLRNIYDRFQVTLCMNPSATGGVVQVSAEAHHASTYQTGTVQQKILSFLQNQIPPIATNLQTALSLDSVAR